MWRVIAFILFALLLAAAVLFVLSLRPAHARELGTQPGSLWSGSGGSGGSNLYDIVIFFSGVPANSQNILLFTFPRAVGCPANMTGSYAASGASATGSSSLVVKKNSTQIGTIDWSASGVTGTFTGFSATSFVAGDVLKVIAPVSADTTLGDIYVTFTCTHS